MLLIGRMFVPRGVGWEQAPLPPITPNLSSNKGRGSNQNMTFLQPLAWACARKVASGRGCPGNGLDITYALGLCFQFAQVPEVSAVLRTWATLFYSPAFAWLFLTLYGCMAWMLWRIPVLGYSSEQTRKNTQKTKVSQNHTTTNTPYTHVA